MYLTRSQSIWISISITAIFLTVAFLLGSTRDNITATVQKEEPTKNPKIADQVAEAKEVKSTFSLTEFHRSEVKDGKKVWEIKAKFGSHNAVTGSTTILNPKIWFYKQDGKVIKIKSNRAKVKMSSNEIKSAKLLENVIISLDNDMTLKTEEADYDYETEKVFCPSNVHIKTDLIETMGVGLEAWLKTKEVRLLTKVRSVITPAKKKK